MLFKKQKINQNKLKPPGKKRRIVMTLVVSLTLLFGRIRTRSSSSQSTSSNLNTQIIPERVINTPYVNSFEYNHRQVVLVKADAYPITPTPISTNRGPSNFPTPSAGAGNHRSSQPGHVPKYRTAPKVVDQGLGGGGGANPAGAGGGGGAGGSEFADQCPISENPKFQESKVSEYDYSSNAQKKNEEPAEQCDLEEYNEFESTLDANGNPDFKITTKDGSEIFVTYNQALAKYYHHNVYENIKPPKNFNSKEVRALEPKDRVEYLKKTVPRDKVIEFQIANAKSLSTENLLKVPGFIGSKKEPGTLYINKKTRQVHFVNNRTNIWRTTVIKSKAGLRKLAKNGFHLFPNVGKK